MYQMAIEPMIDAKPSTKQTLLSCLSWDCFIMSAGVRCWLLGVHASPQRPPGTQIQMSRQLLNPLLNRLR